MRQAVEDMSTAERFCGYGPEQGYEFLRDAIAENDYRARGAEVLPNEIFISDGAKCDTGNLQEIFGLENIVAVTDPVYPVYVDTNVMAGRTGQADSFGRYDKIVYMPCTADNNFVPDLPSEPVDLIYLCYPNNPTGAVATKEQLKNGWITPKPTKPLFCLMPPMRRLFRMIRFRIRFMKWKEPARSLSSSAFFQDCRFYGRSMCFYGST